MSRTGYKRVTFELSEVVDHNLEVYCALTGKKKLKTGEEAIKVLLASQGINSDFKLSPEMFKNPKEKR